MPEIFGTGTVTDVVYVVIGLAGLMMVPRLLEELRTDPPGTPDGRLIERPRRPGVHTRP